MSRPKHKDKDLEKVLTTAERQGWIITGGGNTHYKMKCPCPRKCMKTMATTPSGGNYTRNLVAQLGRVTCWKETP